MRLSSSNIVIWLSQLVRVSAKFGKPSGKGPEPKDQQLLKYIVDALAHYLPAHDKLLPTVESIDEIIFRCRRYVVTSRLVSLRRTTMNLMRINERLGNKHSLLGAWGPRFIAICDFGEGELHRITSLWITHRSERGISNAEAYQFSLLAALDELCKLRGVDQFAGTLVDGALFGSSSEIATWCSDVLTILDVSLCGRDLEANSPYTYPDSVWTQS